MLSVDCRYIKGNSRTIPLCRSICCFGKCRTIYKFTHMNVHERTHRFHMSRSCSDVNPPLDVTKGVTFVPFFDRFDTKICTKPNCKCVVCGQAISFGHKMSNCKECHIWSHVSCTVKIGPTCGLPQAMMQHYALMNKNTAQSSSSLESSLKSEIEGNIRVLRYVSQMVAFQKGKISAGTSCSFSAAGNLELRGCHFLKNLEKSGNFD